MAAARTDKNKPPRLSLWPSTKQPVAANDTLQQFASGSMASDGSAYDPVGTQPLVKERLKARFRRSGSKLLSLLGIRGSWNGWFLLFLLPSSCLPSLRRRLSDLPNEFSFSWEGTSHRDRKPVGCEHIHERRWSLPVRGRQ